MIRLSSSGISLGMHRTAPDCTRSWSFCDSRGHLPGAWGASGQLEAAATGPPAHAAMARVAVFRAETAESVRSGLRRG